MDLVDVERFRAVMQRRPGLGRRIFTEAEIAYATSHRSPWEHFAARFAAKEATMKALGVGLGAFSLRDAEVERASGGAPSMRLHAAADDLARQRGIGSFLCSLSHAGGFAQAVVIAQREPGGTTD